MGGLTVGSRGGRLRGVGVVGVGLDGGPGGRGAGDGVGVAAEDVAARVGEVGHQATALGHGVVAGAPAHGHTQSHMVTHSHARSHTATHSHARSHTVTHSHT